MIKKTKIFHLYHKFTHFISKNFLNNNSEIDYLQESVENLIEEHKSNGQLSADSELEIEILKNIFSYKTLTVNHLMIPRIKIDGLDINSKKSEIIEFIKEKRHTRFPIFKDSMDNVIGYINVKDLFEVIVSNEKIDLEHLVRPIMFVPETMRVISLLSQMRKKKMHIALVVDEYGGTDGIITIEDLIEEIIGDLEDEHDLLQQEYVIIDDNTIKASAEWALDEFEKIFKVIIEDKIEADCNTLGGMVLSIAGRVPIKGEKVAYNDLFECEILDSNPRKINKILIKRNVK